MEWQVTSVQSAHTAPRAPRHPRPASRALTPTQQARPPASPAQLGTSVWVARTSTPVLRDSTAPWAPALQHSHAPLVSGIHRTWQCMDFSVCFCSLKAVFMLMLSCYLFWQWFWQGRKLSINQGLSRSEHCEKYNNLKISVATFMTFSWYNKLILRYNKMLFQARMAILWVYPTPRNVRTVHQACSATLLVYWPQLATAHRDTTATSVWGTLSTKDRKQKEKH